MSGGGVASRSVIFLSQTHTHIGGPPAAKQARQVPLFCVWLILLQWETDPAGRNPLMAAHAPSLSRLKARGASQPFQSPAARQPESPSTPVINTEPRFLLHSGVAAPLSFP